MSGHMNDINVDQNVITNQLTKFTGEEIVLQEEMMNVKQFDTYSDKTFSDVENFLKRPRFLERIGIPNVTPFALFYPLDRNFFETHFQLSQRYKGCNGVRFKTCFRLVASATPQTQGVLRAFYDPIPTIGSNPIFIETYKKSSFSLHVTNYTQLPGVEMDFRTATALDFSVPYTHTLEFMPLSVESDSGIIDSFSMGAVNIVDYLPIRFTGTKFPYLTTYCWLEDLEVFGAVNDPLVIVMPQSGGIEDVEKDGPMSGPLYKLSSAAKLVGSAIPTLTSMMSPLSWALRTSAHAIASFGYSKPLQLEHITRVHHTNQHYQNNADGPDSSFNMGLLQANAVSVMDNIGFTNVDEMSLAFLTTKSCCIDRLTVTDATIGRFYTLALAPTAMWNTNTATISTVPYTKLPHLWTVNQIPGVILRPSPLMWLSTMFNKYRGGFRVTVKNNATMFHAGRVMLTYTPYVRGDMVEATFTYTSGTVGSVNTDATGINVIWDFRESNSCSLDCEYFALTPFLRDDQPIGTFSMSILDSILLTGSSTATIAFAVEVSGLPGFDFEEPHQGPYIVEPTFDLRTTDETYEISQIVPQSGNLVNCSQPNERCVGEKILSLKQLLSRDEWVPYGAYKAFKKVYDNDKGIYLPHWFEPTTCFGTREVTPGVFKLFGSYQMSTHNSIVYAYLFARGGTCYDIVGDSFGIANYGVFQTSNTSGQNQVSSQMLEATGHLRMKAPFYNNSPKVYAVPAKFKITTKNGGTIYKSNGYGTFNRPLMYYSDSGDNARVMVGKRAADDAQLGFFMYAPPLRYIGNGAVVTTGIDTLGAIDAKLYYQNLN